MLMRMPLWLIHIGVFVQRKCLKVAPSVSSREMEYIESAF